MQTMVNRKRFECDQYAFMRHRTHGQSLSNRNRKYIGSGSKRVDISAKGGSILRANSACLNQRVISLAPS